MISLSSVALLISSPLTARTRTYTPIHPPAYPYTHTHPHKHKFSHPRTHTHRLLKIFPLMKFHVFAILCQLMTNKCIHRTYLFSIFFCMEPF